MPTKGENSLYFELMNVYVETSIRGIREDHNLSEYNMFLIERVLKGQRFRDQMNQYFNRSTSAVVASLHIKGLVDEIIRQQIEIDNKEKCSLNKLLSDNGISPQNEL